MTPYQRAYTHITSREVNQWLAREYGGARLHRMVLAARAEPGLTRLATGRRDRTRKPKPPASNMPPAKLAALLTPCAALVFSSLAKEASAFDTVLCLNLREAPERLLQVEGVAAALARWDACTQTHGAVTTGSPAVEDV